MYNTYFNKGILVIDISVPGHSREDLEARVNGEILCITSKKPAPNIEYSIHNLEAFTDISFHIPKGFKVDILSCKDGILQVLMSKDLGRQPLEIQ